MADKGQGKLAFAIVDEVDSILIDEARTPLDHLRGGQRTAPSSIRPSTDLIPTLTPEVEEQEGDFTVDEKQRSIELTESGHEKVEGMLMEAGSAAERRLPLCRDQSRTAAPRALRSHGRTCSSSAMSSTSYRRARWC